MNFYLKIRKFLYVFIFLFSIGFAFQNCAKKDGSLFSNSELEQVESTEPENTNQNEFIPGSTEEPKSSHSFNYEFRQLKITHEAKAISFKNKFNNPVVLVGPTTSKDIESGVVRIRNLTPEGFEIYFQEWGYINNKEHSEELVDILAIEEGVYQQTDGSVWEAKNIDLKAENIETNNPKYFDFKEFNFQHTVSSIAPIIFASVVSENGKTPVTVRLSDIGAKSFKASLREQENYIDGHTQEVVSYLAIHYPETNSSIISNITQLDGTSVPYDIRLFDIDSNDSAPILGTSYYLQEEQSDDNEISHSFERAAVLRIGNRVLAQVQGLNGGDTFVIRRR
ncbi:MAG: hypothetical protein KDD58_00715 [Bdellovibrionales bacterium]|nr:hypothetical protein [Bdellovibrionales bacterium]